MLPATKGTKTVSIFLWNVSQKRGKRWICFQTYHCTREELNLDLTVEKASVLVSANIEFNHFSDTAGWAALPVTRTVKYQSKRNAVIMHPESELLILNFS